MQRDKSHGIVYCFDRVNVIRLFLMNGVGMQKDREDVKLSNYVLKVFLRILECLVI